MSGGWHRGRSWVEYGWSVVERYWFRVECMRAGGKG